MHGYLALVIPVRCEDPARAGDEECVLKVSWRDEATVEEAHALRAWDGQGAVQLLDEDPVSGALLLERLDPARSLATLPVKDALAVAGGLLRRLAIPAPPGFRSLPAVAATLCATLPARWEEVGRPFPRATLERACELASALGPAAGDLLVNYDLHDADILAGRREPWLAVDPKVVVGDPEYGVAQLLWRRLEEIQAHGGLDFHVNRLVHAAQLDSERTRAWTLVRCVDYWLWGLEVGLTEDPERCRVLTAWCQKSL